MKKCSVTHNQVRRCKARRPKAADFLLTITSFVALALCVMNLGAVAQQKAAPHATLSTAHKTRKNPKDGMAYVWIPPGSFMMGCSPSDTECFSDEKPSHQVTLSRGYWIGQTEVTVAAFERFAGISDAKTPQALPTTNPVSAMPIVDVTWDEADQYCRWSGGRLPTEAQWEFAARAGALGVRYEDIGGMAWYEANNGNSSHPTAQKRENAYGLFDMLGNVWEWVADWYGSDYYSTSSGLDPSGPTSGTMRVLRGGSWLNPPRLIRFSDRGRSDPDARFNYFGMRCIWEPGNH